MQNLISNWTKINQDHVEYFEKDEGSVAGGASVQSGRSNLSHALNAAGVGSPEDGSSPPPRSGSSLSNVSFSKDTITTSRQPTPDTATSTYSAYLPTRGVLSSHDGGLPRQHQELYQLQQMNQALMLQNQQNSRRRPNHVHGGGINNYHNQINNPLPPPQAGADAILGRRKPGHLPSHHYNFDMAAAMGVQRTHPGEPPQSLSNSEHSEANRTTRSSNAGGLQRSQSSSLWHSQGSSHSNHSSRSSNSVTASLDKMDAAAQAAMAELNSVNSSLNHNVANLSASNRSAQLQPTRTIITNPNISSSTSGAGKNNNPFRRQKLKKSHSRSDLVREMAIDRRHNTPSEQVHHFSDANPIQRRVSERSSASGTGSSSATPVSSLNMSKGKSTIPSNFSTTSSLGATSNNSAVNSHTMMQDWNQSLMMKRQSSASAGVSSGSTPLVSNKNLTADRRTSNLSQGGNLGAINEQQPVDICEVNIPSSKMHNHQQPQMEAGPGCDRCAQMESAILSLQADIEYVRTLELQKEFVCRDCENGPQPPAHSVSSAVSLGSKGSRSSRMPRRRSAAGTGDKSSVGGRLSRTVVILRDASKRLTDLSTRHKKEVKQSHYERAYWQNDMHLKLEKFAMMCKNLNEDAARRSNEVKELTAKLEKVTSERNGLVSQVESLKARVGLYEGESFVQSRLRDKFEKGEANELELFDKAMKDRDEIIEDLSKRLTAALEEVEKNRFNLRARRQIIFPPSRTMSSQSDPFADATSAPPSPKIRHSSIRSDGESSVGLGSAELSEKALLSMKTAMDQSSDRERAMQNKLDELEYELEKTRAILSDAEGHLEAQWSLKHTSSNSSL